MGKYIEVHISNLIEENKEELHNAFNIEDKQRQENPEQKRNKNQKKSRRSRRHLGVLSFQISRRSGQQTAILWTGTGIRS